MSSGRQMKKAVTGTALGLLLWIPGASAQPVQTFETLVKMLDSPELAVRETATGQLSQGDRFALPTIERALTDPSLSPEQRQRLRWVGQQLFARSPRAALGISFVDWEDTGAVVEPVKGFDSERVLRAGDSLSFIDGQRVISQTDVRQVIISHDPGEEVALGIVRSGTPMTVTAKMGRLADLPAMNGRLTPPALSGAWTYRLARLGEPRPAPVEPPISAEQWRDVSERTAQTQSGRSEQMQDPFTGEPVRSVMNRPPVSTLSLGGQTRQPADEDPTILAQRSGPVFIQRGARGNIMIGGGNVVIRDQGAADRARLDNLRQQKDEWLRFIRDNTARLNDPKVPEAVRNGLKAQNDRAASAIRAIDAQLQPLTRVPEVRP